MTQLDFLAKAATPYCSLSLKRLALAAGLSLFGHSAAEAQVWNWSGGGGTGNTNWGNGTNWVEPGAPASGTSLQLIFGGSASYTATNNIGSSGSVVNLNSITTTNTAGTITINQISASNNRLTVLSGTSPAINFEGAGNLSITAPLFNNTAAALQGEGTGTLSITQLIGRNAGRTLNVNLPNAAAVTIGTLQVADNNGTGAQTYTVANATNLNIGSIVNGVAGTGNFTKNGLGTLTITGAGTYNGATTVNAGILNIRNNTSLGAAAGGTTVASGATLQLQNGITVGNESLTLGGIGAAGEAGALVNVSGTNNFGGALTLTDHTTIASLAGTFNLTNNAPIVGGNFALTLAGANGGTLSTTLDNSISGFTKNGAGQWDLGGTEANTFNGTTYVNAGNLRPNKPAGVTAIAGDLVVGNGSASATIGIQSPNQFASSSVVTINGSGGTAGLFRLNNHNQTIGGLVSAAGQGIVESNGGAGATLTIANTVPNEFGGIIRNATTNDGTNGALGITVAGTSTLTLSGTNTYRGKTTVTSGTLIQGSAGAFGNSSSFAVIDGGVLDVSFAGLNLNAGKTLTAGRTSGSGTDIIGNVTLNGATLEVSQPAGFDPTAGTFTQEGNLTLDNASLKFSLSNVTTIGAGVNDLVVVDGNLNLFGTINVAIDLLNGPLAAGNYSLFQYTGALTGDATNFALPTGLIPGRSSYSYDTSTAGSVFLTVTGNAGILTWIGDGTANVWDKTTLGNFTGATPDSFFNGDIVSFTDDGIANPIVNITDNVQPYSLSVASSGDYTFAGGGSIDGLTGLEKSGSGTLAIQNANAYTGVTNVTAGAISVENAAALGATSGNTVISDGAQVQFNNSGTAEPFTINGTGLGGTGALRNIAGTNTLSGLITLQSDASIVNSDTSNVLTLDVASGDAITGAFGLTFTGPGDILVNDPIAIGTGTLTKAGSGTLTLAGTTNNTNTGLTTVVGGTLDLAKTPTFNAIGGNLTIGNGTDPATVRLAAIDQLPNTSVVHVNTGGVLNLDGFNETVGALTGTGFVTLGSATLTLSAATVTTFDGVISGTGGFSRMNGGTTIFNTPQEYAGATNIQQPNSQIRIAADNALPVGTTLTFNGTTNTGVIFDLNGYNQTIAALTGLTNGAGTAFIQNNSGAGLSILTITNGTGQFGGASPTRARLRDNDGTATGGQLALAITGGTTIFRDSHTYTGPTTISGGTYQLGVNNAVSAASAFSITGSGVLNLVSFNAALSNLTGNGTVTGTSGILTVTSGDFSGLLTGGIGLTKANDGTTTFTLSNTANTFTGTLSVNFGTLAVASLADDGAGSNGEGAIRLLNGNNAEATLRYVGSGATTDRSIDIIATGGATANAILDSSGSGPLTVGGVSRSGSGGTGQKTFSLQGTNTDLNTVAGAITDGANLLHVAKDGPGTWVLGGDNAYTGTTTVSAGKLVIDGDNSAATGAVNVAAGATLSGSGTLGGLVKLADGASVAPGNSAGSQNFAGGLDLSEGGIYHWELAALSDLNPGTDYDTITVAGDGLTLGGTSTLLIDTTALGGSNPDSSDTFWTTSHSWTIATSGSISDNFASITNGTWASGTFSTSVADGNLSLNFTPVPEPSTFVLGALGGLGFIALSIRRRRNAALCVNPV